MEMRIEDELFARTVGLEVVRHIKKDIKWEQLATEVLENALCILKEIQCILDDESLDDPECFQKIEQIVHTFHTNGISTARHDWG